MYPLKNILFVTLLTLLRRHACVVVMNRSTNQLPNGQTPATDHSSRHARAREVQLEQQKIYQYHDPLMPASFSMEDTQQSEFDSKNWFCLDTYLTTHSLPGAGPNKHHQNKTVCKCLMNIHCSREHGLSIWFRCFDFDDSSWLRTFQDILSNDRYIADSLKTSLIQQQCSSNLLGDNFSPRVWLDFVKASPNTLDDIYRLINRLNAMRHIFLTTLQLRNCSLTTIPANVLQESINLSILNLTHNHLTEFDSRKLFSVDSQLTALDLSHNRLERIDLNRLPSLQSLNLVSNNFTTVEPSSFGDHFWNDSSITVQLEDNPWNCDAHLTWLIEHYYAVSDKLKHSEPECFEPLKARMLTFSLWKSIQITKFCNECSCTLRDKYAKYGKRYVTVNCTGVGLTSMPIELPRNTKIVDVSNNRIRSLSNIVGVEGWNQITNLYIQNNSLETLEGFEELSSAALIDFSGNLITEIPRFIITKMNATEGKPMKLDKIRMGNNPYSCDCLSWESHDWIKSNHIKIADLNEVRCGDLRQGLAKNESLIVAIHDKFKNRPLVQLQRSQLCPKSELHLGVYETMNIIMTITIVCIIVKLTYDYFWQKRTGKLPRFFKLNV